MNNSITCRLVIGLLCVSGCEYRQDWAAHDVPLSIAADGASTSQRSPETVSVSMVFSTGWVWAPVALPHPESVQFNQVEIHRIELVRAGAASLLVPRCGSGIIWGLALLRSENDGYAFFCPGFLPVFSSPMAASSNFRWSGSPIDGTANVQLEPLAAATTQPSKRQDFERILQQKAFWSALKSRYVAGKDHDAIELVCECVSVAADTFSTSSTLQSSNDVADVLEWCQVVTAKSRR